MRAKVTRPSPAISPEVWLLAVRGAAQETLRRNATVTPSEWVRDAIREKAEREGVSAPATQAA